MSQFETAPNDTDIIHGNTADVAIINDGGNLEALLNDTVGYQRLYYMKPEGLPYPIKDATIDFFREDDERADILSLIEFDAYAATGCNIANWQLLLNTSLRQRLEDDGYEIYTLPHELHDFYVKINALCTVHVQFSSDTDTCYIGMNLVSLSKLEVASNYVIYFDNPEDEGSGDTNAVVIPSQLDTLRDASKVMLLTIDTLSEELGLVEAEKMPKGTVAIQAPTEAEITYTVTSRELVMKEDRRETYDPMSAHVSTEGFDMIGGLTQAKRELQNLAEILHDPITAKIYGVAPRPFLLHGPPGTGKTSLVTALANQIGAELKIVSSTDIIEKWVGSSGKNVRKFFDKLIEESANKTVVVLFDEFEALAQKGGGQERLDVKKQLNLGIENIVKNHPNIILGAAANMDMDDLEPSLIRSGRFKPIGAPLPNEDERVDVWAAVLAKSYVSFANIQRDGDRIMSQEEKPVLSFIPYEDDIDPKALAKITDGMTGADFDEILTRARLRQYVAYRQGGGVNKVSQADLITEVTSFGR